jgi:predicted DsbA family dithiol-disulfide isomerase
MVRISSTGTAITLSLFTLVAAASCASATPEPKVPSEVLAERAATPAGMVTIVEYVDFECPFCRAMNDDLSAVIAAHRDRVRIVRKQVPLIAVHPHALAAARASVCADELGKGDAMADALFHAPLSVLTDGGCMALATRVGLDAERFTSCFDDARTMEHIQADVRELEASGGGGVPTVWIDGRKFEGERDAATMRQAVLDAISADSDKRLSDRR